MQITLREPGSALTHFIAMILALCAASPLLIKAAQAPGSSHVLALTVFITSMILCLSACHAGFYHQHDLIIWCKCHIPFCQSARIRDQNTAEGRSLHDLRPDCRLLHTCLPSGAGPETGIPIADRSLVACIDRDRH